MTVSSSRIAQLLTKELKATGNLKPGEVNEVYRLLERWDTDVMTSRKIIKETVTKLQPVTIEAGAATLTFASGGELDLSGYTLSLDSDYILDGTGGTLTMTGNSSLSGSNTGDVTLATNSGLALSSQVLNMGTPSDVTSTSTNSVTTSTHTHAADSTLARSAVTLTAGDGLTGGGDLSTNRTFTVGAGDGIDVSADSIAVDVTDLLGTGIAESSNNLIVDQAFTPTWTGAHTFQANMTARHILPEATDTYDLGSTTKLWRKGYLSELDALIFAESTISLVGGWLMLCKDQGTLPTDLADDATTYDFGKAMTPDDFIVMRAALKVEYIQIGSLVSGTEYNITRDLDGTGANDWAAGTPFANFGYDGNGRLELNSYDTPRISMLTHGTSYNEQTEILRIGDLNSGWGYESETYGVAIGARAASTPNLTVDATNGIRIFNNATQLAQWDTSGNVLIGQAAASQGNVYITSGAIQLRNNTTVTAQLSSGGDFTFGEVGASKFNLMYDVSEGDLLMRLNTTSYFQVDGSASLLKFGSDVSAAATTAIAIFGAEQDYNGEENLGAGDLLIGDNTASKANVLWDKSAGKLLFRGGTTTQAYIDTTGALTAGYTKLDTNGISIAVTETYSDIRAVRFVSGTDVFGILKAQDTRSINGVTLAAYEIAGYDSKLVVGAYAPISYKASATLAADSGGAAAYLEIDSDSDASPGALATLSCPLNMGGALNINTASTTALLVEQDGVKDNVLVVDTTKGAVGINRAPASATALAIKVVKDTSGVYISDGGNRALAISVGDSYVGIQLRNYGVAHRGIWSDGSDIIFGSANNTDTPDTWGSALMTLKASGYLGINDTSPAEMLDVNGNINCTGVIKIDDVQVVGPQYASSYANNPVDTSYGNQEANLLDAIRDCLMYHGLLVQS